MNAKLPDRLKFIPLKTLLPGKGVWITPWSMGADSNNNLWLDAECGFSFEKCGTHTLYVKNIGGLYIVDVQHCRDYRWRSEKISAYHNYISVAEITGY